MHVASENRLKVAGWDWAPGKVLHTYEGCRTGEEETEDGGRDQRVVGGLAGDQDG